MVMIQTAQRGTGKERKMFEDGIMWAREDNSVLWICRDRRNKKSVIQRIFDWVDKKRILDIRMWKNSKSSIESIVIKNYCGKTITIMPRLSMIKPATKTTILDDLMGDK